MTQGCVAVVAVQTLETVLHDNLPPSPL
jgi:hypothetical protein